MRLYQSLLGRPPHGGPTFMCPPLIVAVGVIRDLEVVRGAPTPIGHVIVDPCGSEADSAGAVDVDRDDLGLLVGKAREDQPASIRRPPGPTVERLRRRSTVGPGGRRMEAGWSSRALPTSKPRSSRSTSTAPAL